MAKTAALVITGISIALLVIYGADAVAGAGNPDHQGKRMRLFYIDGNENYKKKAEGRKAPRLEKTYN